MRLLPSLTCSLCSGGIPYTDFSPTAGVVENEILKTKPKIKMMEMALDRQGILVVGAAVVITGAMAEMETAEETEA